MKSMCVLRRDEMTVVPQEWGELRWFAGAALGNSDTMTVGQCLLNPGCSNPLHSHPNCSEILHVLQGRIRHTFNDGGTVDLAVGDTISVPPNLVHRATNIGEVQAILQISFSSPDRQTRGEGDR